MIHEGPTLQLRAKLGNQKQSVPITWCRYQILFPLKSSREPQQYIYFGPSGWAQAEECTDTEPKPLWQSTKLYIQMHLQSEMHMSHFTCTKPHKTSAGVQEPQEPHASVQKTALATQTWSSMPIWYMIYFKLWFVVKFSCLNRFMKCLFFLLSCRYFGFYFT